MIPIADYPPQRRHLPFVMLLILVTNILVFLLELSLGPGLNRFIMSYGTVPFEITHAEDVAPTIPLPVYFTLITSMFIHAGILHIASNMLFLWVFGDNVEDQIGHFRFLAFYLLCGLAAALSQIAITPNELVPAVGASGAIAGVLGAYIVLFPQAQVRTLLFIGPFFTITRLSAFFLIGFWIVLQVALGFISLDAESGGGVAYFAHIGGFVAGLILIHVFYRKSQVPEV